MNLWNAQVEETMLTSHAVAELTDPSSGLEQQLLGDQIEDLRREFSLLRHVPVQKTSEPGAETASGLEVLSTMVGEYLGAFTRRVSNLHACATLRVGLCVSDERTTSWCVENDNRHACPPCSWQVVSDKETSKDPVTFVDSLLAMQAKLDTLVREAFFHDKALQEVKRRCESHKTTTTI